MKTNIHSTVKFINALFILFVISTSCCPKLINLSGKTDFESRVKKLNSLVLSVDENSMDSEVTDLIDSADTVLECPCKGSDGKILKLLVFDNLTPLEVEGLDGIANAGAGREGDQNFEFNFIDQFEELGGNNLKFIIPTVSKGESLNYPNFHTIDLNSIPNLELILDQILPSKKIKDLVLEEGNNYPIIAVMDTGIDPGPFMESEPFLNNTANLENKCPSVNNDYLSGWNFVNNNNNVFDGNGHGTIVTKIITNNLDKHQTNYSILPLKILDENGTGTYWNVICALSYLSNLQNNGSDLKIINSSFGGALETENLENNVDIFKRIFSELGETLMVASAGNKGINNDIEANYHFPSNVDSDQILAVGGYRNQEGGPFLKHASSNYGKLNVDVATLFEGYQVEYKKNHRTVKVRGIQGTSYGAAYLSSRLFEFLENGTSGGSLQILQFLNAKSSPSLGLEDYVKDKRYIKFE